METHFSNSGCNSIRARDRLLFRFALALALVLGAVAFAATVSAAPRSAQADADDADVTLSPYFQVKGAEPGVDALPLKSTQVDAVIAGIIAEVRVVQTYQNDGATALEARYIFPASTRAAVHGMSMTVGERRIEAQIKEKEEARKTYEKAKREGKTASLLESHRSNIFEMNVANILPGDTVTVELRYNELITPEDGEYEWVFPTVVGPRYTKNGVPDASEDFEKKAAPNPLAGTRRLGMAYAKGGVENEPVFALTVDVISGVSVKKVRSPSHRVETAQVDGGVRVTLPPNGEIAMNRDFILRYRLAGDDIAGGLLLDEFKGEKYYLFTLQPPARVERADVPPRDYLFVVDVSGSMWGFPLDVAQKLLREMLLNLRAGDSFNILLFSGSNRMLFERSVEATPENIASAFELFETGKNYNDYGGGTELLPALKRALSLPNERAGVSRSIVVITDGYVDIEAEAYALVKENLGRANLFAFGIGSSVNRELIERLSRAGNSEPTIITNEKQAKAGAERFRKMVESPVLTNVRMEISGETSEEADVLAQRPFVKCGKWRDGAGMENAVIRLSGQTGEGPWSSEIRVADAMRLEHPGTVALLWARTHLDELRDLHALRHEPAKQKAAMIELGLKYNLLTPFTSFVAVDLTPRISAMAAEQAKKVTQALPLPKGVSERAIGVSADADEAEGVPTSPEPETIGLMIVAAMVAAIVLWRRRGEKIRKGATR